MYAGAKGGSVGTHASFGRRSNSLRGHVANMEAALPVLHGESDRGQASPRTTTTMTQTKPPTTQPCSHQTANEKS